MVVVRLTAATADDHTLARIGADAMRALLAGDFDALAENFGYALAFGRNPVEALRADASASLRKAGVKMSEDFEVEQEVRVLRMRPNSSSIEAVVECRAMNPNQTDSVFLELVVTVRDDVRHVTIEQVGP